MLENIRIGKFSLNVKLRGPYRAAAPFFSRSLRGAESRTESHSSPSLREWLSGAWVKKALVFFFFFTLPFGTKKFLFPLGEGEILSESDAVFLFLNDIWLPVMAAYFFFVVKKSAKEMIFSRKDLFFPLAAFVLFTFLSIFVSSHPDLSVYSFIRLVCGIFLGFFVAAIGGRSEIFSAAAGMFVSGIFQSILGGVQFISGKSAGLRYLGEVIIDETTKFVARTDINGALFLRAYGTMQHANICAAFLTLAFLSGAFLLIKYISESHRKVPVIAFLGGGLFIIMGGIALTFSRSGWISFSFSIIFFLIMLVFSKKFRKIAVHFFSILLLLFASVYAVFGWAIIPRASFDISEPSVDLRIDYLYIGSSIVTEHPVMGVGIGNQTKYASNLGLYGESGVLRERDYQPIHNIFLLALSEIGFLGFFPIGIFFATIFFRAFRGRNNLQTMWLLASLAGFFVFGMFDHFFWTTQSGIAMFWIVVFLLALSLESGTVKFEPSLRHFNGDKKSGVLGASPRS